MTTEQTTILPPDADKPQYYPHTLFKASPTQPRKTFIAERIQELSDSIVKSGQLQPILARPNPEYTGTNGMPPYEIVFGESRWRAVQLNDAIPGVLATIRELTDFEVIELQIIENMARTDLHPYEEAEGLQKLLRTADGVQGYANAEELAARLGKSRRWVYLRLSLLNLAESAREAFLAGTISASIAGLLARMTDPDQQARATAKIVQGWGGEPMSFRAAADYLKNEFMLDLGKATFNIEATYKVAGPCGQCPKRSGANPDLFAEISAGDMCQDSGCYRTKTAEQRELLLEQAVAAGHKVLREDEARKFMPSTYWAPKGFLDVDKPADALTDSERPLREHFGKKEPALIVIDHPYDKKIVTLISEDDARKLLKAKRLLREESADDEGNPTAAQVATPKPRSKDALDAAINERADISFGRKVAKRIRDSLRALGAMPAGIALEIVLHQLNDVYSEEIELVLELQGWSVAEGEYPSDRLRQELTALAEAGDVGRLFEVSLHASFASDLCASYSIGDFLDEDGGTLARKLTQQLGFQAELEEMHGADVEKARHEVLAEERERLGIAAEQDATAAFVEAHAPTGKPAKNSTAKYQNQATGETWSGRGLQPKWLKAALTAGAKLEDFEVTA